MYRKARRLRSILSDVHLHPIREKRARIVQFYAASFSRKGDRPTPRFQGFTLTSDAGCAIIPRFLSARLHGSLGKKRSIEMQISARAISDTTTKRNFDFTKFLFIENWSIVTPPGNVGPMDSRANRYGNSFRVCRRKIVDAMNQGKEEWRPLDILFFATFVKDIRFLKW